MRVQAITEVNTRQQQNPNLTQNTGYTVIGKSASRVTFEECLKSQMQNASSLVDTRRGEWMATGSIWGYLMTQEALQKSETKPKERA